jgi:uncharacterized repeat protein (TIGR03837 family)
MKRNLRMARMKRAWPADAVVRVPIIAPMRWDVFCRVVDNFGDIGVCWRLAADLAGRGETVRLWVDDASALAWMAPQGTAGVEVRGWHEAEGTASLAGPGDVVVEAFGCDPPARFVQRMAARASSARAPVWINLEYLSAEAGVERLHGLPSPQLSGPGLGLTKWFFYPGFAAGTGGLLREPALMATRKDFDESAWLARRGIDVRDGERRIGLFCYENPALPGLLDELAQTPTLLLATAGHAARQVQRLLGAGLTRGELRAVVLPLLTQTDFDALLWSCELNFVRGEDSFVRAQWAGRPFVWQIYPQADHAHRVKLSAFLDRFLARADPALGDSVRALWQCWNGADRAGTSQVDLPAWHRHCETWRGALLEQPDLTQQLIRFVAERR